MPNLKVWDNAGGVWRYVSSGPLGVTGLQGVQGNTGVQSAHVLAYTGGLGAFHSATGLVIGQVLKATSATDAGFGVITNITPGANFTLTQNSVVPFTSEETSAVVNTLYLKAGNVGIGTTNPASLLQIGGSGKAHDHIYTGLDVYGNDPVVGISGITAGAGQLVGIEFNQMTTNNVDARQGGAIKSVNVGGYTAGTGSTYSSDLAFYSAASGGTNTERMRILANGNVGIGTTGPGAVLDLGTTGGFKQYVYNGGVGNRSGFGVDSTGNSYEFAANFAYGTTDQGRFTINSYDGTTFRNKVTVLGSGNVGIGTTSPTNGVLEVVGQVYFSANCSALSYTDRTPFYSGDAIAELKGIKGKNGKIDHKTLPEFARAKHTVPDDKGKQVFQEERDLGAMISMLVVASQQLDTRLSKLEGIK